MEIKKIRELIGKMTLEEKAGLCSGSDFWHTKAIERLGVPSMMVSDGPHGLRKQIGDADHLGRNASIEAVCFPTGCALAASFDRDLIFKIGQALGEECQAEGVGVLLGPAVNIKRSPLCGRNFEYFSEDPFLTSEMASSQIKGVQSRHVGTSIKHFLANSQEHRRMSSSSELDERTAREIYLPAFEQAVKKAEPWTVMCSYNKINGTYAAANRRYLTEILRDEWGFDGFTVSDWGAVNDRVEDLEAGLDLEMPSSFGMNDERIAEAVRNGTLSEKTLDQAAERILNIVYRFFENRDLSAEFDKEKDHALARDAAGQCMVLLKNEGILPIKKDQKTAFIGEFAKQPRYQGGGSSHINSFQVESAVDMADLDHVLYAQGFHCEEDRIDGQLMKEALEAAGNADTVVIFAGLPDSFESEGYDRTHISLPECQNLLIEETAKVNPNIVVVLHNGSPVAMPWIDKVKAVLEVYLGGQAVGGATVQVLYGEINPSGRLAETFPLKLEDNPSYLYYGGEGDKTEYREGIFVGYRYYDTKKMDVLFPFGHGLSYTEFEYRNLTLSSDSFGDSDILRVSVEVVNVGKMEGKEVVQLYVAPEKKNVIRPVHELKGFEKISLKPGETGNVIFELDKRSFAYFDMDEKDWRVETGNYTIEIGQSSRNIRLKRTVKAAGSGRKKFTVTLDTTVGDAYGIPGAREALKEMTKSYSLCNDGMTQEMIDAVLWYMPIRGLVAFGRGNNTFEDAEEMVRILNQLQAQTSDRQ